MSPQTYVPIPRHVIIQRWSAAISGVSADGMSWQNRGRRRGWSGDGSAAVRIVRQQPYEPARSSPASADVIHRSNVTPHGMRSPGVAVCGEVARVPGDCRAGGDKRLNVSGERHWITWSARSNSDCGRVRSSAFAVLRLRMSSNFVGCSIGNSAGLVPLRILSTYVTDRRKFDVRLGP